MASAGRRPSSLVTPSTPWVGPNRKDTHRIHRVIHRRKKRPPQKMFHVKLSVPPPAHQHRAWALECPVSRRIP